MILPSVESEGRYGHSNSLVKRLVGADGKYLGLDKVLVCASNLPVANSTPEARDVEPPQDCAPSPTPAQRACTPMAPIRRRWHSNRQRSAPPPGVRARSPTPPLPTDDDDDDDVFYLFLQKQNLGDKLHIYL